VVASCLQVFLGSAMHEETISIDQETWDIKQGERCVPVLCAVGGRCCSLVLMLVWLQGAGEPGADPANARLGHLHPQGM
jgi:hypothetical protein